MAVYGSGVFYGRAKNNRNVGNYSQIGFQSLPDELDIGPPFVPSPIKSENVLKNDLIILAEFSEVEGPVPLLCIPKSSSYNFDLHDFVLQLMSTDYQSLGNLDFEIYEDTCLFEQDLEKSIFTYVHYFTLFDVRARGFVRPLCLAYVTNELKKIIKFLPRLRADFSRITEYLRVGNLDLFKDEMCQRIEDLNYTKEKFIETQRRLANNDNYYKPDPVEEILKTTSISKEGCNVAIKSNSEKYSYQNHARVIATKEASNESTMSTCSSPCNPTNLSLSCEDGELSTSLPLHLVVGGSTLPSNSTSKTKRSITTSSSQIRFQEPGISRISCDKVPFVAKDIVHSYSSTEKLSLNDSHICNESITSEEAASLEHTSLDALAAQLLDCQRIMEVVSGYLSHNSTKEELETFCKEVKSQPFSPLNNELITANEGRKFEEKPSIFVISLMRRSFRNMRHIKTLCGLGYVACIAKLLKVFEKFSKPMLTLMFEELDKELYDNPLSSLFIGNIPIMNVGLKIGNCDAKKEILISPQKEFSLSDYIWNEDLVVLLHSDPPSSKETTPESEYVDVKEAMANDSVVVADDCLLLFTGSSNEEATNLVPKEYNQPNTEDIDTIYTSKSEAIQVDDGRHRSDSELSWSPLTPKDDWSVIENRWEALGEEEEVLPELPDISIRLVKRDIDKRMEDAETYQMSALIQQFSGVSQCLLETLLSGKPLIVAGPEHLKSLVKLYTKTLSGMLPQKANQTLPVLRWHTGTIVSHHLSMYKIIGVCIPERLHVQDLMSNATLNKVTVINVETGHISGVAYSGELLHKAEQLSHRHLRTDSALQAALQALLVTVGRKVYLYFHLLRTTVRSPPQILKGLGVAHGDWPMVQYLTKLLQDQIHRTNVS